DGFPQRAATASRDQRNALQRATALNRCTAPGGPPRFHRSPQDQPLSAGPTSRKGRSHMTWTQNYAPLGNLFLSALVAALPVIVLLGSLAFFHVKAHVAALLGLATALLVAILVFHMPAVMAGAAAVNGAAFGLFPIGWIVLNAIFVYDIAVGTGQFEMVKHTIANLAADRRI